MSTIDLAPDWAALDARIGVLGDLHGDNDAITHTLWKMDALGVRHVVQVGDFWAYDDPRQVRKIIRQSRGIERLLFLDGNHENFRFLGSLIHRPGVWRLNPLMGYMGRGTPLTIGGLRAVAVGGAVSRDRYLSGRDGLGNRIRPRVTGKDWWPEEALAAVDVTNAAKVGPVDVLLSHDAPDSGIKALGYRPNFRTGVAGSEVTSRTRLTAIHRRVKPGLTIHGHFHTFNHAPGMLSLAADDEDGSAVILDTSSGSPQFTVV